MKRPSKWLKIDAILGKPNASHKAKMLCVTERELGRWVAAHLEQGYTVTLTKVEAAHARSQGFNTGTGGDKTPNQVRR